MHIASGERSAADDYPLRASGLRERALADELVLYDPERDQAFLLNRVAAAIFDLCDGATSQAAIALEIAAHFAVPEPQARADVRATLSGFALQGLVVRAPRAP